MTEQQKSSTDKRRRNRRRGNRAGKPQRDQKQQWSQRSNGASRWNRHRLSQHFMRRDFDSRKKDCSCKGTFRISMGLIGVVEGIRAKYGKRVNIVNGYYCPDCMPKQYGVKRNLHHSGLAADITVESIDPKSLFLGAESFPEINGLGLNLDAQYVHIDTRKGDEREMWVIQNNERIPLTDENRSLYLPPEAPEDVPTASEETPADTAIPSDANGDISDAQPDQ